MAPGLVICPVFVLYYYLSSVLKLKCQMLAQAACSAMLSNHFKAKIKKTQDHLRDLECCLCCLVSSWRLKLVLVVKTNSEVHIEDRY